jgi:glyceraldehyde-3-phosphate dehydrogenase/erythrose-4-phosphate dehydrogenase
MPFASCNTNCLAPVVKGLNDVMLGVLAWYDNEGFSCRMADNAVAMGAYI